MRSDTLFLTVGLVEQVTLASREGVGYAKDSNTFPEVSAKKLTPEVDHVFGQENRR